MKCSRCAQEEMSRARTTENRYYRKLREECIVATVVVKRGEVCAQTSRGLVSV